NPIIQLIQPNLLKIPAFQGLKIEKLFYFQNQSGFIQKYYGTTLPYKDITTKQINEILNAHQILTSLNVPVSKDFIKTKYIQSYEALKLKSEQSNTLQYRLIRFFLAQISPKTLIYESSKLKVIHGDFHARQILFKNGHLFAFIDWEDCRFGYPAEDYWYFIWYNQKPGLNLLKNILSRAKIAKQILNRSSVPYNEWETAINIYLLSKLEAMSHKISLGRIIRFVSARNFALKLLTKIKQKEAKTSLLQPKILPISI
ncbi:MAG: phosphotransferase, partial [Alphaproteobacteria bacterium]|nr:phosphotransferase [Alphaproteobacteria bacterium]